MPIYEDLAYFLVAIETNRLQSYSWGMALDRALLDRYFQAFLAGYFGKDEVPSAELGLFQVQALLDKWASQVEVPRAASERGPISVYENYASNVALRRSIKRTLEQLERHGS